MILSCNSCEKKFVVPDQAITSAGRMVQCGSCGNKWRQFPIKIKETLYERKNNTKKTPHIFLNKLEVSECTIFLDFQFRFDSAQTNDWHLRPSPQASFRSMPS